MPLQQQSQQQQQQQKAGQERTYKNKRRCTNAKLKAKAEQSTAQWSKAMQCKAKQNETRPDQGEQNLEAKLNKQEQYTRTKFEN